MKRELTGREREEARRVFGDSLDYGDIRISEALGLGGRPWARCGIGIYVIYVGIEGFRDAIAPAFAPTFIHELTHVWQGRNGRTAFDFMLKSAACQCRAFLTHRDIRAAYRYEPGAPWSRYNVEQQASIVADWYRNGLSETDPLFPYIRDHIRFRAASGLTAAQHTC
jgi:hypothetical protein